MDLEQANAGISVCFEEAGAEPSQNAFAHEALAAAFRGSDSGALPGLKLPVALPEGVVQVLVEIAYFEVDLIV